MDLLQADHGTVYYVSQLCVDLHEVEDSPTHCGGVTRARPLHCLDSRGLCCQMMHVLMIARRQGSGAGASGGRQ